MMDEEISRIMGILFLYPLVAFFLDYLFFKTQLSFIFYIGALLMTFSALLMSYKPNARIFVEKKHLFYMFIIILLWGIHGVLLKTITKTVDVQTFLFLDTALVLIIAVIITLFSKTIQHQMREFFSAQIISTQKILCLTIAGITIMYIIALLLSFKAYNLQKVSLIASFETIQPTFVFLIALFLSLFFSKVLKEEVDKKTIAYKIIALVLLSIGICLVVRSTNI
jgi:drug/metabolite transporter (DMT)-like permease